MNNHEPVELTIDLIKNEHQSVATFAKKMNASRQTVYNWIDAGAHWWRGDIWLPQKRGEL